MDIHQLESYAPYIVILLMFLWQNNVFVRPEQLEKKHREVSAEMNTKLKQLEDDIETKYVEVNAYKEFQTHIYSKLDEVKEQNDEIKALLMSRRRGDNVQI